MPSVEDLTKAAASVWDDPQVTTYLDLERKTFERFHESMIGEYDPFAWVEFDDRLVTACESVYDPRRDVL